MATWGKWVAIVGGLIAVVGQFVGTSMYLPVIGGLIAVIGGLAS